MISVIKKRQDCDSSYTNKTERSLSYVNNFFVTQSSTFPSVYNKDVKKREMKVLVLSFILTPGTYVKLTYFNP